MLKSIALTVILFAGSWFGVSWWVDHKLVSDAEQRYQIAAQGNDARQKCSQAEEVVAAQLHTKRAAEWEKWKAIAAQDCSSLK